jgi:hypothetical protein
MSEKVYDAEKASGLHNEKDLPYTEAVQFIDRVRKRKISTKLHGKPCPMVTMSPGKGGCRGLSWRYADLGKIIAPEGSRGKFYLLHEFAHVIAPRDGHGVEWRNIQLALVRNVLGVKAWKRLYDEYKRAKLI